MERTLRDLQLCELEIAREVVEICRRHHLQLYMMGGILPGSRTAWGLYSLG